MACPVGAAITAVGGLARTLAAATVNTQQMVASVISYYNAGDWVVPFTITSGAIISANALLSVKKLQTS